MPKKHLLRQNSELKKDRIWNWSIPSWVIKLEDGRNMNVCPQAGVCKDLCYALNGTYLFPAVRAAHERNLIFAMDSPYTWLTAMSEELSAKRFRPNGEPRFPDMPKGHLTQKVRDLLESGCAAVRIHDSGDFFSGDYLRAWCQVAANTPDVLFYAYTKSISMCQDALNEGVVPPNMLICYSLGGKQDHLIDRNTDYHADVFPDEQSIEDAGYFDQSDNDLLCVLAPSNRIGIPSNNIRHFQKRQGEKTFSQMESALTRHSRDQRTKP